MTAWYNEIDPYAAQWLRRLIKGGHIAPGVVDTRDIRDISPDELTQYTQLHFFAGIGGWSLALRQSGWPDDRPVWTGSCPCQPFSNSGKRQGFDDERHLWPAWYDLVKACQPARLFGEQVAAKAALDWFDLVSNDLEAAGYAVGAADICAAGVAAPHIRQRLWFGAARRMAHALGPQRQPRLQEPQSFPRTQTSASADKPGRPDCIGRMAHANRAGLQGWHGVQREEPQRSGACGLADPSPWQNPDWIWCRDSKWRPVEPGLCPMADGIPTRVGRLRAYGNAIVPQVAATFIEAFEESLC